MKAERGLYAPVKEQRERRNLDMSDISRLQQTKYRAKGLPARRARGRTSSSSSDDSSVTFVFLADRGAGEGTGPLGAREEPRREDEPIYVRYQSCAKDER